MCKRWYVTNDFMIGKYSRFLYIFMNKRLYEYYPQRPVHFVHFLANPSKQTYFSNESPLSLYVYYCIYCLLSSVSSFSDYV